MEIKIAACGLICSKCDVYRATQAQNQTQLKKLAEQWSATYEDPTLTAETIQCDGCMSDSPRKNERCLQGCRIRECALKKNIGVCGECESYPCKEMHKFFQLIPNQSKVLMGVHTAILQAERELYTCFSENL